MDVDGDLPSSHDRPANVRPGELRTDSTRAVITPLQATILAAHRGLTDVLPYLKKVLDDHPEIWKLHGDLARQGEEAWIKRIAAEDLLISQSLRRQVEQMRAEMTGPAPTALDSLLVDRVIVSWLAAQHAELAEAIAPTADAGKVAVLRLKRAESANRRLLAATKTLAQVRRLAQGISLHITHEQKSTNTPCPTPNSASGGRLGALLTAGDGLP
jgi:hypothetical protein